MSHPPDRTDRIVKDESVHTVTPCEQIASAATVSSDAVKPKPTTAAANVDDGGPQQPGTWREADANYPTDPDNRDPISGFRMLKSLLREIEDGVMSTPEPSPLASALAL